LTLPRRDAPSVVVVGAGHNGLVSACYLAAAGLDVTVLERRDQVGGACVTEELVPGIRGSSCAFVAGPGLEPAIMRDLQLEKVGLELYQTDVLATNISSDGQCFSVYRDNARTLQEIAARYGRSEAIGLMRLLLRLRMVAAAVNLYTLTEPPSTDEIASQVNAIGPGHLFEQFFSGSVADLLDSYLREDALKDFFTFLGLTSVYGGPRTPGTAYVYSHHAWGEFDGRFGQFGFVRGGMGAISEALCTRARSLGARVETSAPVARIEAHEGSVRQVALEDGREFRADLVLANTDPKRTFLRLLERDVVPPDLRRRIEALDFTGTMARVHIAVEALPQVCLDKSGRDAGLLGWSVVGAQRERYERAWSAQQRGDLPEEFVVEFTTQTLHDPTLAPDGRHLIATGVQQLPFKLREGTWDDLRPQLENRVISTLSRYMPGLEKTVVGVRTLTPLDLEREYGLTDGNLFHGAMCWSQLFADRPLPSLARGRTPIQGLYLCGSGIHPGGGVTGAPGYNASHVALEDLGLRSAWPPAAAASPKRRWALLDRLLTREWAGEAAVAVASRPRGSRLAEKVWG
jgi:phytoene dehydrogenase-like protein